MRLAASTQPDSPRGRTAMRNLILTLALSGLLLPCRGFGEEDVFAPRKTSTRRQAVVLSALFPGLGQLSSGRKVTGTILLVAEIGSLATALTANENYNTRLDNFERLKSEYEQMAAGNSRHDLAEQQWQEVSAEADDLNNLHNIRRTYTAAAVGIYVYNLVDILLLNPPEAGSDKPWGLRAVPALGEGPARLMVTGRF